MTEPARIFLFRHGQSAAPPGLMVGRTDFDLSETGRREAEGWRDRLAGLRFTLAVASPLARARRTAEIILEGRPDNASLKFEPDLVEISLGRWESRTKDWLRANYPDEWAARGRDLAGQAPPGGESFSQLAARVRPAFHLLAREAAGHANTLVVAHQAVIRVILAALPGDWPTNYLDIDVPPAALAVIAVTASGGLSCLDRLTPDGQPLPIPTPPQNVNF